MANQEHERETYQFGPFYLDATAGILEHRGARVGLSPKVLDTLVVLVRHGGRIVDKQTLLQEVWPGTFVAESGLTRNLSILRKTLDSLSPGEGYVETVPKRGYRFVAPLAHSEPADPPRRTASPQWRIWLPLVFALPAVAIFATGLRLPHSPRPVLPRDFLIAAHLWQQMNPEQVGKSVSMLEQSLRLQPSSARMQAAYAQVLLTRAVFGKDVKASQSRAHRAAEEAVHLDPSLGEAYLARGIERSVVQWDWKSSEMDLKRAIELDPSGQAYLAYACLLWRSGKLQEAEEANRMAAELDPVSPTIATQRVKILYSTGRFLEAAQAAENVLDRDPGFALARYYLALSLAFAGSYERALQELERANLSPGLLESERAWIRLRAGQPELARKRAAALPLKDSVVLEAALGNASKALEGIERLIAERSPDILGIKADPRLQALRQHPGYIRAVAQIGL